MVATFKATLKADKRQDGTRAVRIRITRNRKHSYYNTGIYLVGEPTKKAARKKGDWNPSGSFGSPTWVRTSHPLHARYNADIRQCIADLDNLAAKDLTLTAAEIKTKYEREKAGTIEEQHQQQTGFLAFFREWIRRKRSHHQTGTADLYSSSLKKLTDKYGELANEPALLTPTFGSDLVAYLRNEKDLQPSTINVLMTTYRTIFSKAVLEGYLPPMRNPFDIPPLVEPEKDLERPTDKQITDLMQLQIPKRWRMAPHARAVFLMQYFLHGARFAEVATLKWEDITDTHISYLPFKRAKKKKSVARHAGIEWVLNQYPKKGKYVFPYITEEDDKLDDAAWYNRLRGANRSVNLSLDKISKLAELPMSLRTHMQRHTFADQVFELTGDLNKTKEMLGHANTQTTEKYMKRLKAKVVDEVSAAIYGGIGKQ